MGILTIRYRKLEFSNKSKNHTSSKSMEYLAEATEDSYKIMPHLILQ